MRCDEGIDHGPGVMAWMHPPVHRLLGWVSKPSSIKVYRDVWRLNQLRGLGNHEAFVKGAPAFSEASTLDRLPTLLNADLLNKHGRRLGSIVDLVFIPQTGIIVHYLVSRTDPRVPGTSRWRLLIDQILDQQPGIVSANLNSLDDLPLVRSSVRQDLLRKSKNWRDQIQEMTDHASLKLEGWLEEPPWDQEEDRFSVSTEGINRDPLLDWDDELENQSKNNVEQDQMPYDSTDTEEDPWV